LVGGLEIVVHNLALTLANLGHKVYVITPYNRHSTLDANFNYRVIRFGFRGYGRLKLGFLLAILTLAYVVLRYKIDVINVHNVSTPASWAYYFRFFSKRQPIIGTPHGDDIQITPEIQDGIRLNSKWDKIVRRNLSICTRITAISPSVHKDLNEMVIDPRKIVDVPNGVWVSHFRSEIDKADARKKLGIPLNSIALISIGRNHPRKGFKDGLDAVAKLRNTGNNISYILVGRNMSPIIERARSLGILDCLIAPGEVNAETISLFLQASDIYVSPSIVESFGLTTLEAMSAGLPCVVTDVAGSKDLVTTEYGLLVEPANSDELAAAIQYLIDNPILRHDMGAQAHIEAEKYDWPNVARMYVEVYKEALTAL
jgi:glycosyltransferase involved in cell wall biosynthesis